MRLLSILLLIGIPLFSQERIFLSNNSGMKLQEVDSLSQSGSYLIERFDDSNSIVSMEFIEDGITMWIEDIRFNGTPSDPVEIIRVEDEKRSITTYKAGVISTYEEFESNSLSFKEVFNYRRDNQLISIQRFDSEENLLYKDSYYRNRDGALREVRRSKDKEYINHWFYKDGWVNESWFLDGKTRIRTKYLENGETTLITGYEGEEVLYSEEYFYNDKRELTLKKRTTGDIVEESTYLRDNLVSELKIKENDIVVRIHSYSYADDTLINERIFGHGKLEEYLYSLNSEGDVILISYYLNKELKSNTIIESDEWEIKEYFRNGDLYLREYYKDKERMEKEFYRDGQLIKSEKYGE